MCGLRIGGVVSCERVVLLSKLMYLPADDKFEVLGDILGSCQ